MNATKEVSLKVLAKAGAILDRILNALMVVACVIFTFTMLLVCANVIMRYALHNPILWSTEVCEYILVGIASLGMAWLLREEGHVKVDFLLNQLKPGTQALMNGITSALAAVAVLIITWYGLQRIFIFLQNPFAVETGILRIHKSVLLIPLAIGCFLLFVQFARRTYKSLRTYKSVKSKKIDKNKLNYHERQSQIFLG